NLFLRLPLSIAPGLVVGVFRRHGDRPAASRIKPRRRPAAEAVTRQRALVSLVAQGVVPLAEEPQRCADSDGDGRPHLRVERQVRDASEDEEAPGDARDEATEQPEGEDSDEEENGYLCRAHAAAAN